MENWGGVEDLLFGFACGGIAAALYLTIFHERLQRTGHPHRWIVPVMVLSEVISILILFKLLGLNSIYASAIGFLIPAVIIVLVRHDLLYETVFSALLFGALLCGAEMGALLFAPTYLQQFYDLYGRAPLLFGIAPLTEFLWGAAFGSIVGPVMDFDHGLRPVAIVSKQSKQARRPKVYVRRAVLHTR